MILPSSCMDVCEMKILQQQEFYRVFTEQGVSYQSWLGTIEKESNKKKIQVHFQNSLTLKEFIGIKMPELQYQIHILAFIAEWCGDCHRNIPILVHVAESEPRIELKFLDRDKNTNLVNLTNGGKKIPYVLFYGQDGFLIDMWVERPTLAYKKLAEMYREVGFEDEAKVSEGWLNIFTEHQNEFYREAINEIITIIDRINVIQGTSRRINTELGKGE